MSRVLHRDCVGRVSAEQPGSERRRAKRSHDHGGHDHAAAEGSRGATGLHRGHHAESSGQPVLPGRRVHFQNPRRLAQFGRASWYRKSRAKDQSALRLRIRGLAHARPRFWSQRIWVLLRREGWLVNRKRVRRLSAWMACNCAGVRVEALARAESEALSDEARRSERPSRSRCISSARLSVAHNILKATS